MGHEPRNMNYLHRGLFFITLSVAWILWEQGTIKGHVRLAAVFLIMFGIAVIFTSLLTFQHDRKEATT